MIELNSLGQVFNFTSFSVLIIHIPHATFASMNHGHGNSICLQIGRPSSQGLPNVDEVLLTSYRSFFFSLK